MHTLLLLHPCGIVQEALLLGATYETLRLAVPGEPDVVELQFNGVDWLCPDGTAVTLGAVLRDPSVPMLAASPLRAASAGTII